MAVRVALLGMLLLGGLQLRAQELPWWVDSIEVTLPGMGGIGAVSLSGTWIDTGAPDAIGHSILDGALHLSVSAPDLNVPTGDALTPWSLTEEFGPLDPFAGLGGINEIRGSIFSVDPNNRGVRQLVSGPDFLGWIVPPPRGEFEGLGTGEAYVSAAHDVSADGRVVAGANHLSPNANGLVTSEAFVWTPETGRTGIGLLPGGVPGGSTANAVSADGNYLAGVSTSGRDISVDHEAFRWSLGAGMEGLGTINGPSSHSEARAVSRGGRVVVGVDEFFPPVAGPSSSPLPFNGRRAFRYTDEGGMEDLGVLPDYQTSEAVDVSSNGQIVVGNSERYLTSFVFPGPTDLVQPFRWTEESGMVGLGNLPRFFPAIYLTPQQETVASAVSADGRVVVGLDRVQPILGAAEPFEDGTETLPLDLYPSADTAAVRWTEESGWTDLGQLRNSSLGYQNGARATDVSGDGNLVIGSATIATPCFVCDCAGDFCGTTEEVPFLWDEARGMRPLERVLAGDYGLDFEGWSLGEAAAISDDGSTIVGTGTNPDGVQEAWRAVLQRNTRPGDADFDGDVDQWDYATVAAGLGSLRLSFGEGVYYEDGDFDSDGAIGEDDLLILMANYDGRHLGDFNADGVVDTADYTVWRDHLGLETGVADSTGDGLVTENDLTAWRANYGKTLGDLSATAVPEPAAALSLLLGAATGLLGRGRRRLGRGTRLE